MKSKISHAEMAILLAFLFAMVPLAVVLVDWLTAQPIVDMRL